MKRKSSALLALFAVLSLSAGAAHAGGLATGAQIKTFVSGSTVQGSMLVDKFQKYSEFYMVDGTIKGDGYEGKWAIVDDTMCFEYGGTSSGCWGAKIDGPAIIWLKDGEVDGAAVAKTGNGNNY